MSVRIDKFLWAVRLCKTRKDAVAVLKKNRVTVNGQAAKPSKMVDVGDTLTLKKHTAIFSYKVIAPLEKRVGAKLVADYIVDVTPTEEKAKFETFQAAQRNYRAYGSGKPTKKERRALNDLFDAEQ